MSKTIPFDTRTTNYLDFVGNGKRYRIPAYQRDYSWSEEQWDDLWTDLTALEGHPEARHYMGTVVVEAISDREFVVIDGQQRLATFSVLALAIISRLLELADSGIDAATNRDRAQDFQSRFIGERDPASRVVTSKLTLNATDNGFYQDYLVARRKPKNRRGLPRSNRALQNCFDWFSKKIVEIKAIDPGRVLAELLNESVARQFLFIVISVDSELNAYTIFETLNARGLELSATDLLKNYLFSRMKASIDLEALQRRWARLIATVRSERFPEFLRYHLLCKEPQIRSARLFKLVRDSVDTPDQVFDLIDALEARSELFTALSDASHDFWVEQPDCKPLIRERLLYRGQQSMPLMFAAWEKFSSADFVRVLKLVNVITFRFTTVSNLNSNELEPVYHHAAKAILDGRSRGPADVFNSLVSVYVPDERFRQNFESVEVSVAGQSRQLTRYILCRLETDSSSRMTDSETDSGTIEHILPENPVESWFDCFSERDLAASVSRLGNLTLLEPHLNRQIANAAYSEKIAVYATSHYAITASLAQSDPEDWTATRVAARQKRMAERAVHLWRSDFA
jgi:hypothetical protein